MKEATQAWIAFAGQDMQAARVLLQEDGLNNIVLFHCQQAIEKSIKAILEEYGLSIPRTHNITRLYGLLPDSAKEFIRFNEDDMDLVDEIYINFRYPSELGLIPEGSPSRGRTVQTFEIAQVITSKVADFLKL